MSFHQAKEGRRHEDIPQFAEFSRGLKLLVKDQEALPREAIDTSQQDGAATHKTCCVQRRTLHPFTFLNFVLPRLAIWMIFQEVCLAGRRPVITM